MSYSAFVSTTQPNTIKQFFNCIKEQATDINMFFNPDCIEILEMDNTQSASIYAILYKEQFEKFECKSQQKVGINVKEVSKILKNIDSSGLLSIYIDKTIGKVERLIFTVDNESESERTTYNLKLLDLDICTSISKRNLDADYRLHIDMPSSTLQSIISKLRFVSDDSGAIRINYSKNKLCFFVSGDKGDAEHIIDITTDNREITVYDSSGNKDSIIEVLVKLSKLVDFIKCSSMSKNVSLYIKNHDMLYLKYDINGLGEIQLGLSPKIE